MFHVCGSKQCRTHPIAQSTETFIEPTFPLSGAAAGNKQMAQVLSAEGEAHEHELRELRTELASARAEVSRLQEAVAEAERVSRAEKATAGLGSSVQGAADAAAALAAAIRRSDAAEARAASSAIAEREAQARRFPSFFS